MNVKNIKRICMVIIFGFVIWILSNSSQAAYVSVKASATSASPGQNVSVTISSDCIGKVNLSASNGTLSTNAVFIDGAQTVSLKVGNSGTAVISATPVDMSDSNGNPVSIGTSSTSISIKTASSSTGTTSNTENSSTTKKEDTNKKSSNANLSNLGIKPNDFSGFKAATTTYNVTVPEDVEEVEVYATAQDSKAIVSGTGKKQLQMGANTVSVTVTAEDGTKKTYTINITREGTKENEEDEEQTEEVAIGLSELKIGNLVLSPEFKTNVYEYTAKYIGEDTKLDINTVATDANYVVEVTGNEDLKEGENIITILVSDAEGNNVATYQVTVNKSLVDEEAIQKEQEEKEKQKRVMIIGIAVAVVVLIVIIVIIIKRRRNSYYDEDWESEENHNDIFAQDDKELIDDNMEDNDEETQDEEQEEFADDKQALREKFLENYNFNDYSEYEELDDEKHKRRKRKGKRFK